MKKLLFLSLVLAFSVTGFSQMWSADFNHSKLGFTVTHLGISDVSGHFDKYDVKVNSSKPDFSDAVIELSVETNSVNTRVNARDNHLRSEDFFDVEKFPSMVFKSTGIKSIGENKYELAGNLTMLGITKPVSMTLKFRGTHVKGNKTTAGLQVKGTIKRSDFNLGSSFPNLVISDEVEIKADGEFVVK